MILETGRLSLRPCSMDDVDALHALWTDADVRRYLWDGAVIDRETAQEAVQSALEDWADYGVGLFCIRFRREPAIIGFCGLRRYPPDDEWELLYGLGPAHWGQGLAVEAARAVLDFAFSALPVHRIAGRTDPPNTASIRVLEKLGMQRVGAAHVDGRAIVCYSMARPAVSCNE